MISARRSPTPGTWRRWSRVIRLNSCVISSNPARGTVTVFLCSRSAHMSESAAGVPEVATVIFTFACSIAFSTRPISSATKARSSFNSFFFGGSCRRNSRVRRTAPSGRLTIFSMFSFTETVSSQLPPPKSTSSMGDVLMRLPAITPK